MKKIDRLKIKLYCLKNKIRRWFLRKRLSYFSPECYCCFKKKRKVLMKEFIALCKSRDILLIEKFLNSLDEEELTALWLNLNTSKDPNDFSAFSLAISLLAVMVAMFVAAWSEELNIVRSELDNIKIFSIEEILGKMGLQEYLIRIYSWLMILTGISLLVVFVWLLLYWRNLKKERYAKEIVSIYRGKRCLIEKEEKKTESNKNLPSKFRKIQTINNELKVMKRKRTIRQG